MSWLEVLARLGAAALVGAIIGWERQLRARPAGLRTHILVGMGAAIVVAIPGATGSGDVGRAIQGVATGVGFICAGDILHRVREGGDEEVKGLTSAAALWLTAGLGMAAALGRWALVVIGTALALVTLAGLRVFEKRFAPKGTDVVTKGETRDVKGG